jgi:hypothetical protein
MRFFVYAATDNYGIAPFIPTKLEALGPPSVSVEYFGEFDDWKEALDAFGAVQSGVSNGTALLSHSRLR